MYVTIRYLLRILQVRINIFSSLDKHFTIVAVVW